jgi:hypothetical protein
MRIIWPRGRIDPAVKQAAKTIATQVPSDLVRGHREQPATKSGRIDGVAGSPGGLPARLYGVLGNLPIASHAEGQAHERRLIPLDELLELVGQHRSLLRCGEVKGVVGHPHHHIE